MTFVKESAISIMFAVNQFQVVKNQEGNQELLERDTQSENQQCQSGNIARNYLKQKKTKCAQRY